MPTPKKFLKSCKFLVITGGSSGIGMSLIKTIRTLNTDIPICNLSRSRPDDFDAPNCHHLSVDLTEPAAIEEAVRFVRKICPEGPGEVVLVNNSGFGDYGVFQELEGARQLKMIDLNVRAMVDLTARLMPLLLNEGGRIVNIASTAAFQPCPVLSTYAATKAFVLHWSLALGEDLRGTLVRVLCVCPGPTATNFFRNAGFGDSKVVGFGQTADEVAEESLRALARGRSLVVTGWNNKLLSFFGGKLPKVWIARMAAPILRHLRSKVTKEADAR